MKRCAALLCALLVLPPVGATAETFTTLSPNQLHKILLAQPGEIRIDAQGDTTLEGELDSRSYQVYFYHCDGGELQSVAYPDSACLGFEFRTYFYGYPTDSETLNTFNDDHHYGHLWRDTDGDMALQMNVVVEGGVTDQNIIAVFKQFRVSMEDVDEFMEGR